MDDNPYASPIGVASESRQNYRSRLGLGALLLSVVATGLLVWVATRITVDRSQSRIPIVLWHWPGRTGLFIVACCGWLLSLGGIGLGGWTFDRDLPQSTWGKMLGLSGFFLAIFNFMASLFFWVHMTED